jgi:hypothetical protein
VRRAVEPLENRVLFSTFTVTGTAAADTISLSVGGGIVSANVNGNASAQLDTVVTDITINALGSNDTIIINSNGNNPVTVNAGTADDIIQITPTSQSIDSITADVTVNGEAGTDTFVISDQALTTAANYHFNNGNELTRDGNSSTFAYNTMESVELGEGTTTFHLTEVLSPSTSDITVHGSNANSRLFWVGTGTGNLLYNPSGTTPGSGELALAGGHSTFFDHLAFVEVKSVNSVQYVTPNSNDTIALGQVNSTKNKVTGTSGGISMAQFEVSDSVQLQLSLGVHDGADPDDTVVISGTMGGVDGVDLIAGPGSNTATVSGGPWTLDTTFGSLQGTTLDVIDNGAAITFQNAQSLHKLTVNSGGSVNVTGATGTVLTTPNLAVTAGVGNLNIANGQGFSVAGGVFSIGANCTLNKISTGTGTLSIGSSQSHGANSTLSTQGGQLFLVTDAGTAASRTLNLISDGITNLNASQHLASIIAAGGAINMENNGNRVLVTGAVSTGSESGILNLGDNDMILDYTGATQFPSLQLMLRVGRDHGIWDGLGINSLAAHNSPAHNTTLGMMEATDFKGIYGNAATFAGQTIDTTALLVKYTYYGDTDFNGKVNFDDYVRTDSGFNNHKTGWVNGDFDFNDAVNFDDYVLIDLAFNTQGSPLSRGRRGSLAARRGPGPSQPPLDLLA